MTRATQTLPDGYQEYARFERRESPQNRRVSYFMYFAAVVFFAPLFAGVTAAVRPGRALDPVSLWSASIPGFGSLGILLLAAVVSAAVLYLHALTHAAAVTVVAHARPSTSMRGIVLVVTAPSWYIPKAAMVAIAVAPFFAISVLGVVLLSVLPSSALAWVYVPLLANAVASSRDVITLSWLLVSPKKAMFAEGGDVIVAYAGPGARRTRSSAPPAPG